MPTKPTLAELQAQITAAQLEIDRLMIAPLQAIVAAFSDEAIQNAINVAQDNLDFCTGEARHQINNLLIVNNNSVQFLKNHVAHLDARVNGTALPPLAPTPFMVTPTPLVPPVEPAPIEPTPEEPAE
jgi:hypothetical protein